MFGADADPRRCRTSMAKTIEKLRAEGRTTMVVRQGERDLGAIGLMDTPRSGCEGQRRLRLRALGIRRMIMISATIRRLLWRPLRDEVGIDAACGRPRCPTTRSRARSRELREPGQRRDGRRRGQ